MHGDHVRRLLELVLDRDARDVEGRQEALAAPATQAQVAEAKPLGNHADRARVLQLAQAPAELVDDVARRVAGRAGLRLRDDPARLVVGEAAGRHARGDELPARRHLHRAGGPTVDGQLEHGVAERADRAAEHGLGRAARPVARSGLDAPEALEGQRVVPRHELGQAELLSCAPAQRRQLVVAGVVAEHRVERLHFSDTDIAPESW